MDLKYIKENNLNEARERFQQINEYILNMNGEKHEADEQQPQDDMQQQQPPIGTNATQDNAQPQDMGQGTPQQPDVNQPQIPAQGMTPEQQPQELDPTIGAEADEDGNGNPDNMENGIMEPEEDMDGEMESDEVIDVDDLTQSQETTEYKLDGVDDKLNKLINIVSKFAQAIDDNDAKVEELKHEIEERNPTQQERLNIRSMSGSPYTVSPQDYWSSQNARNPQYNVIADNDVAPNDEDELYTITDDDIKNFNKSEIEKSINDIPKNLKDYFSESTLKETMFPGEAADNKAWEDAMSRETRMEWDDDLVYELGDYVEAQEVENGLFRDTNFGDIKYDIRDNGYRIYLWFESEEDADDFIRIIDNAVGEYEFFRNPSSERNLVMVEIPA